MISPQKPRKFKLQRIS